MGGYSKCWSVSVRLHDVTSLKTVVLVIRGVSVVKQHNLVIKMLYPISETTCFGQKWPLSGAET